MKAAKWNRGSFLLLPVSVLNETHIQDFVIQYESTQSRRTEDYPKGQEDADIEYKTGPFYGLGTALYLCQGTCAMKRLKQTFPQKPNGGFNHVFSLHGQNSTYGQSGYRSTLLCFHQRVRFLLQKQSLPLRRLS